MKKQKVVIAVLIALAISICAYAAGTNTKKPKKSQKSWKKIVWVDEKGIRHVTLVSTHNERTNAIMLRNRRFRSQTPAHVFRICRR